MSRIIIPKKGETTRWIEPIVVDGDISKYSRQESEKSNPNPIIQGNDEDKYIFVPGVGHFAKERTLYGLNWENTHKKLLSEGLEMPTPRETWNLIRHLESDSGNSEYQRVYDDILKTTPKNTWHGEWQNAKFSKDKKKFYVQRVVGLNNGELVYSDRERLEDCLMEDCWAWASSNSVNSQGLLTSKNLSLSYDQGSNIYFWHPRDGSVAGFNADSDGADFYCIRNPTYSNDSLGVRAVRRGAR